MYVCMYVLYVCMYVLYVCMYVLYVCIYYVYSVCFVCVFPSKKNFLIITFTAHLPLSAHSSIFDAINQIEELAAAGERTPFINLKIGGDSQVAYDDLRGTQSLMFTISDSGGKIDYPLVPEFRDIDVTKGI